MTNLTEMADATVTIQTELILKLRLKLRSCSLLARLRCDNQISTSCPLALVSTEVLHAYLRAILSSFVAFFTSHAPES